MVNVEQLKVDRACLPEEIHFSIVEEFENDVLEFRYGDSVAVVGCGFTTTKVRKFRRPWATVYRTYGGTYEELVYLLESIRDYYNFKRYDFGHSFGPTSSIKAGFYSLSIKERERGLVC